MQFGGVVPVHHAWKNPLIFSSLVLIVFSGCTGPGDQDINQENPIAPDDESGENHQTRNDMNHYSYWRFSAEMTVPYNACLQEGFCPVAAPSNNTYIISSANRTIVGVDFKVEWTHDETPLGINLSSFQQRKIQLSCLSGLEDGCGGLNQPLVFSGSAPIEENLTSLNLQPGAVMEFRIDIEDLAPDPLIVEFDFGRKAHVSGNLALRDEVD